VAQLFSLGCYTFMNIRTSFRLAVIVTFAFVFAGRSQGVILNAGDTWSYQFSTLDYIGSQPSAGSMPFSFSVTTLSPSYTTVSYQLFEQPSDSLIYSGGYIFAGNSTGSSGVSFLSPYPWQSLDGSITFSADAPVSIDSLTIQVIRPGTVVSEPFGDVVTSWDIFQTTVTPTPEPTTLSLLTAAVAAFGLFRFVIRKPQPNKSPEPTAVGAVSSAIAVRVAGRRWLSFFR